MILKHGRIYTMDGRVEEAVAIAGDRIVKVGSNEEIEAWQGPETRVVELQGRVVVPGFNDTHTHLVGYGNSLRYANLEGCRSCGEMCRRVSDFIVKSQIPEGEWVFGRGWDQNLFPDGGFPTKEALDRISDRHPILLIRTCGHVGVANTLALQAGNVTRDTYLPGGQFDRGADGAPNGVIREAALEWFKRQRSPESARRELEQAIIRGGKEMLRYGVTTVHTEDSYDLGYPGDFMDIYNTYQKLEREKRPPLRVYQKISLPTEKEIDAFLEGPLRTGMGSDFYRIGPMKQWSDGTMGARTAGLKEPYSDLPGATGIYYYTDEELYRNIKKAHCAGMQVCIHTIGDGALEQVLNAYERVLKEFPKEDHRHRLVHGQVGNLRLYQKIAALGLNINIQPVSTSTDMPILPSRLGEERLKYCHAWRTLTDLGVNLNGSSDIPVETPNVFRGIYGVVARRSPEHPELGVWNPQEKVTVMEALRFYTINGAYAAFEDGIKGSVTEGKLADLVILDRDPCAIEDEELLQVTVDATILGGEIVYQRNA